MTVNFEQSLQYDELVERLLEKTRAGKLNWQETADEDSFLAAVRGVQTFMISKVGEVTAEGVGGGLGYGPVATDAVIEVTTRGAEGKEVFKFRRTGGQAEQLFRDAERVARRIDQHLEQSLNLLNSL